MKNKATIFILLFYGLFFLIPIIIGLGDTLTESGYNPFDYARITEVDYKGKVLDTPENGGKLLVNERLTFDIHAASRSNPFRELWRDLCEDYVDGLKVSYKVNSVAQILPNGERIEYAESDHLYWYDYEYDSYPYRWYHSEGPYDEYYDQYECVFFYVNQIYREKPVFEIEYEMNNAVMRYGDCSELYISMYSESSINHLESFNAEILIPIEKMPAKGNYYVNTYGTTAYSFPYEESTTKNHGYHTFSMSLDKDDLKFDPTTEFVEFDLVSYGKDAHSFSEYANYNDYYSDPALLELKEEHRDYVKETSRVKPGKLVILLLCFFFSFIIVKKLLNADNKIEEKFTFYKPEVDYDYFREIPSNLDPSFAADLVFCKDKKIKDKQDVYAAILLSLVRKKYVQIDKISPDLDWVNSNVRITVLYTPPVIKPKFIDPFMTSQSFIEEQPIQEEPVEPVQELEPLTETEKLYFNLITRHAIGGYITLETFEKRMASDYDYTDSFIRGMENSTVNVGVSEKYFQKANYKQAYNSLIGQSVLYYIGAFCILVFGNIALYQAGLGLAFGAFIMLGASLVFGGVHLNNMAHNYILLTEFGETEYAKWRGLYKFLDSDTLMNERTVIELPMWEQYLVYATAFGISEKVIKALEIVAPELSQTSPVLSNPYYRTRVFYSSSRSFRSHARSTSSFARSSSGGYGGGGRGGGGGGGGH